MSKNLVVISTSLRGNSNSNALAESFANGAKAAGNSVEITEKVLNADVAAWATLIYYYKLTVAYEMGKNV